MNYFDLALSPFIFIIKQVFLNAHHLTNDYGIAIILLSFCISLMLLPVFILIEKAKKKDDIVKRKMKPLVDEIKRCYKGQERYYYLKTLNRQFDYSPLRALFPVLSLLLQIPFFLAAYQFLDGYTPLQGVSFWFISDLSMPDGLFGAIHILPIAMTLVNLLTAYFYTRNGDASERSQMLVVAGIFLVLLFNLPAGLVLYWTMNNVFSFFRLFVTNREVFRKRQVRTNRKHIFLHEFAIRFKATQPKWNRTLIVLTLISILVQLNWAFRFDFNDIMQRLLFALTGSIAFSVFLPAFVSLYKIDWSGEFKGYKELFLQLWPSFKPTFIVLTTIGILSQINWALQFDFNDIMQRIIMAILAGSALTILIAILVLFYQGYISFRPKTMLLNPARLAMAYKILFLVLVLFSVSSQISWAMRYYFDDIVLRLSLSIFGSWLATILIANLIGFIKHNPEMTPEKIKSRVLLIHPGIWPVFFLIVLATFSTQINWAWNHNFDDIAQRLISAFAVGLFITILFVAIWVGFYKTIGKTWHFRWGLQLFFPMLFLAVYFYLASLFYFSGHNQNFGLMAIFFILAAQIIGFYTLVLNRKNSDPRVFYGVGLLLFIVLVAQVLSILLAADEGNSIFPTGIQSLLMNENKFNTFIYFGIIFSLITLPSYLKQSTGRLSSAFKANWLPYVLSVFYLTGFIFLWNPLTIFSSYPDVFDFPAIEILQQNFKLFAISFSALIAMYLILPLRVKRFWFVFVLSVVLVGFVNNTIVPINMGSLQENKFLNEGTLAQPFLSYLLEGVLFIIAIYGVSLIIRKKGLKALSLFLLLINVIVISQGFIESSKTGSFWKKPQILSDSGNSISFSKDKENVVFLIMDMFHGWYMDKILKDNPELKDVFEGFVWYPNTLSVSSITSGSITPILGGFDYTIDKLNRDNTRTLESKVTEVSENFYKKIKSKGFRFTASKFIYSKIDKNTFDTYLPEWHQAWDKWNGELKIGFPRELGYTILWENAAFYSTPLFLKPLIYNNGRWIHGTQEKNENTTQAKGYNFLRLLPYISNTECEKPDFIYLHSMVSHHPWDIIDDNGKMHYDVSPYENNLWTIQTLARWVEWMKTNGVYDNTKIVLFSDHGPHWNHFEGQIDMDIPLTIGDNDEISPQSVMGMFALMMVKDFDKKEALQIDWRFLSNADATNIAFDENDPTKTEPAPSRTLPSAIVAWKRKIWLDPQVKIVRQYKVKDNLFDLSNWKRVE